MGVPKKTIDDKESADHLPEIPRAIFETFADELAKVGLPMGTIARLKASVLDAADWSFESVSDALFPKDDK